MAMAAFGEKHAITVAMSRLQAMTYRFNKNERTAEAVENSYRMTLDYYRGNLRHPSVVDVRVSYGLSLVDRGRLSEGVEHLSATVEDARSLFGDTSAMVGFFSGHLSRSQIEFGDIAGALANGETNVRVLTGIAEPESFTHASSLANHGGALVAARRAEEALARLNEAIPKLETILAPSHEVVLKARLNRARALAYSGDTTAAHAELDAIGGFFTAKDPPMYRWLNAKGTVARLQGDYPRALSQHQAAFAAVPDGAQSELQQILPLVELGLDWLELRDVVEAEKTLEKALDLVERNQAKASPSRADVLVGLARVYLERQDGTRALPFLEEADGYWREVTPESRSAGEAAYWLGRCLERLGRPEDARKALDRAARILSRSSLPIDQRLLSRKGS